MDSFERHGARYVVARDSRPPSRGLERLSSREREVVAHLVIGRTTKETAYCLGIADSTVRVLVGRACLKLDVQSRVDLLAHPEVEALRSS